MSEPCEITDALVDSLLKGAVDLHCHSGPSVMPRRLDHAEAMLEAEAAGFKAILFKDHYYPVAPVVQVLKRLYPDARIQMLSGVPLNNPAGGINRYAVDLGIKMGARLVWMPTFAAGNHLEHHSHGKTSTFPNPKEQMLAPRPLSVLDDNKVLLDEVKIILDLIADADVVLSTGHLHIGEIWPLVEEAKARGVKRILVNHPTFILDSTLGDVKALAESGAYIEHSICMFVDCKFRCFTPDDLKALIGAASVDRTILGSDLGQAGNPTPVEGFRLAVRLCLENGYSPDEIRKMTSTNGATLMGLD